MSAGEMFFCCSSIFTHRVSILVAQLTQVPKWRKNFIDLPHDFPMFMAYDYNNLVY